MKHEHISHSELVAAADGELDGARTTAVREHLAACWTCRAQMKEIEDTIAQFVRAHQESLPVPPIDAPRAMLRARLAEIATPQSWRDRVADVLLPGNRLAYFGAAMAGLIAILFVVGVVQVSNQQFRLMPDPEITPGLTINITEAELCGVAREPRIIPTSTGRRVFDRYGIDRPKSGVYELDYLIPPELGGAADPRNFWPQPFSAGEWNAHAKDALEDHLREMVCRGDLSLTAAQKELASDWVAAYKKYFRTSGPLTAHRSFTKDTAWEP
jgi:hypothetical protein